MTGNRRLARTVLASLCLTSAGAVVAQIDALGKPSLAEASPYYLGAGLGFTRESNLFRAPDSAAKTSDVIYTTSLLAGFNRPISRQRFFGDAIVEYNRYRDNDQLNNTAYGVNIGWDWATIERLSGTLAYTTNQSQTSFGVNQGPLITNKRNTERTQQFLARGQLGATSLLSLETVYIHRNLDYSAVEFNFAEFEQDSLSLGVLYRPSGLLTLGIAGRGTRGKYPFAAAVPPQEDKFDRQDLDLTAVWVPTGLSRINARLSYTKEDHERLPQRDFSGVTGALGWEYKPTAKLTFNTDLIRDTGSEATFNGLAAAGANSVSNTSNVSSSIQVRVLYEFSAKILFDANARYVDRDLVNTVAAVPTPAGSDKTAYASLGARWSPTRNWLLGCAVGYEKHGGSSPITPLAYDANTFGCSARFTLQ